MKLWHYGDTFKRYAYVGKHDNENQYFVSFTDWTTRQGGSKDHISYSVARFLAYKFTQGCNYIFDPQVGIKLQIDYRK